MLTRNMAETDVKGNGGQGLHARLAGMLETSFLFQNTRCIFSMLVFTVVSSASMSLGIRLLCH